MTAEYPLCNADYYASLIKQHTRINKVMTFNTF